MALYQRLALILLLSGSAASVLSAEDPVAALSRQMDQGSVGLAFEAPYGYLPSLLRLLHVPVESQIAVFSKTSIQSLHIEPANPRVLYFNDAVTVGWVRGGFIELAAQDPGHGIRYYILLQRPGEAITARADCVRCHQDGALQIRSVRSTADGIPSQEKNVDSRTPLAELWGGWFVTGKAVPSGHAGNIVFDNSGPRTIKPELTPQNALTSTSDITALMIFAHQMRLMNLLAHPDRVNELVDALLFTDDARLPGPVSGDPAFATTFSALGPRDHLGRSLRDFDSVKRLMRYPCSYMIYSEAFNGLLPETRQAIYRRMSEILSGTDTSPRYAALTSEERRAIVEILRDTKSDLPSFFGKR